MTMNATVLVPLPEDYDDGLIRLATRRAQTALREYVEKEGHEITGPFEGEVLGRAYFGELALSIDDLGVAESFLRVTAPTSREQ